MDKESRKEFGARLRRLRKAKKKTIKELSAKIGVAESTLSCYENGSRIPDIEILAKLADELDVPTDYLINENQEEIKNLRKLLDSKELTYDGVKLDEIELVQIKNFLEFLIREKIK
ncbi:helix-turn-helix transcriptional regulator [Thermoactinomyces sp. FSL K6-2592]|jgi:transcriptional regulator with XRE-family HTH domain|uniref:helix-turn-helix domain-containing protein n=1 Tax=Thermoactinomyces TaxID=2023 RepID=UPI0030F4CE5A